MDFKDSTQAREVLDLMRRRIMYHSDIPESDHDRWMRTANIVLEADFKDQAKYNPRALVVGEWVAVTHKLQLILGSDSGFTFARVKALRDDYAIVQPCNWDHECEQVRYNDIIVISDI